jgi:methenyltetrahydrofolate cyclohydrolase
MLKDLKVKDFLGELGSNSPAPGGGSTAALAAATSASLTCMVFNLTIGKKMYEEYTHEIKEEIKLNLEKAEKLNELFVELMDKDSEAFTDVILALKLPKDTEEEKLKRHEAIQKGYIVALEVPLELATKAYSLYSCIEVAAIYGNKNAISDAGVAGLMLQAAIESAVLNVKINLSSIKDESFKEKALQHCNKIISDGLERKEEIMKLVNSKI